MPATNYTPIQLYRTATATGTAPVAGNLNFGELAINYNDGGMILYAKNASGNVIKIMNNPANICSPSWARCTDTQCAAHAPTPPASAPAVA